MFTNGISPTILNRRSEANRRLSSFCSTKSAKTAESIPPKAHAAELPGIADAPKLTPLGELPGLLGSLKQIKWAETIRAEALALQWPEATATTLRRVNAASWWIANKDIVRTMKFKAPDTHQLSGHVADRVSPSKPRPHEEAPQRTEAQRSNDAAAWAHSVAQKPQLAEAAILAVLQRLYKDGAIRTALRARANGLLRATAITNEDAKDAQAIRQMLT